MKESGLKRTITERSSSEEKKEKVPQLYRVLSNQVQSLRMTWLVCAAFARGIHYAVLDEENNQLVTPLLPEGRKRSKINKIGSWSKHMMARIVAVRPEFEVESRDLTMKSINAAQCGTAFLQQLALNQRWAIKRHKITSYCLRFGNAVAYVRDYKDETRRVAVPVFDEEEEIKIDPSTGKQEIESVPVEDIGVDILLPHNVLCDQDDTELEDKFEVILGFWRSIEYYEAQYGEKGRKVVPESAGTKDSSFNLSLLNPVSRTVEGAEGAVELVYLQKPNKLSEKGMMVIVAGEQLLVDEEWPYKKMVGYPLVHFRYGEQEPGEFWTEPPIKDQVPPQKDMNEAASIVQENISNVGHIKWWVPDGGGISDINDLSGEMISGPPGFEPKQIAVAALPHYEVNQVMVLDKLLEDIQMFHSVSKGSGTPNVRSKIGLDKLSEEDTTPLSIIDTFFADGYQQLGKKLIQIAVEKLDTPRMVRYVGEGRRRTISDFVGEMLEGYGEVKVRMVDAFLRNKGATQGLILEMFHNGMITDSVGKPDPQKAQKMLQFAIPEMMYDKEDQQRQIQYDENDLLMQGVDVPVEEWEYHWAHLDVLDEMLNGVEWKVVVKGNPKIREVCVNHRMGHLGMIMAAGAPLMEEQGQPGEGQGQTGEGL